MNSRNGPAKKAILIGTDGASMELWKRMAEWGRAPNMKRLLEQGSNQPMIGTHPTLTPCGRASLCPGSWQGTHGIFWWGTHIEGESLGTSRWTMAGNASQSEQIWTTAERSGKTPYLLKQEISWPATLTRGAQVEGSGPGVSNYHQIAGYHLFVAGNWQPRPVGGSVDPEATDPSRASGKNFDRVELSPATGWKGLPSSGKPALEAPITIMPLARGREILHRGKAGVPKEWHALVYASQGSSGYDRVRVCKTKDFADQFADLSMGEWSTWALEEFTIDGSPVEGYVTCKLVTLTPDADVFELFFPQIWPRTGYTNPPEFSEEIDSKVGNFLQNPARDALGFVDDKTYIELCDFLHNRLAEIAEMINRDHEWDLLTVQTHASDYSDHFFMGQADPISGAPKEVVDRCLKGLQDTYESIDKMIGRFMALADDDTVVCVVSDHGATPNQHDSVDVRKVLQDAGLLKLANTLADQDSKRTGPFGPGEVPDRVSSDVMKQIKQDVDWAGSVAVPMNSIDIFIPVKGRDPEGHVAPEDYYATQRRIIETLLDYKDPETGERPFTLALTKQDAEILNISGPSAGDVIYAVRAEYDGVHGRHLPTTVFGIGSQHSTFVLAGPGVKNGVTLNKQVRVIDVAPTLSHLLGWPMPKDVEGGVVYAALEDPDWYLRD